MLALVLKDIFASVSHQQLNNNLKKLGLNAQLEKQRWRVYLDVKAKIITFNKETKPVQIKTRLAFKLNPV
jgi:hypothetical protein